MGWKTRWWPPGVVCTASAACVVMFASTAYATTHYVGPTRANTTLASVANQLGPGDVVEVDGDATYTGGTAFWNDGAAGAPITVRGIRVNGKRPVLSGGNNTIEAGGDHYVFEGLEITGGTSRCFYHHAHDVVLRDTLVRDCPKQGVLGADTGSGSLTMEYVEVTRCGGGLYDHQIYMASDESANPGSVFRMQYCWVHDGNGGNNVKSRAERNEIYYNWIEGAVYHELELIGPDPSGGVGTNAREDSDVVGNVLVKTTTFAVVRFGGDGTGETNGRYRFVNNTVVVQPNGGAVFRLFDGLESVEMHNNAFVALSGGSVNLTRTTEARWTNGRQIAGSNNWVTTGPANLPTEWTATLTGDDPGFADLTALNVRPLPTSALVDGGATSTAGPAGYAFPQPLDAPLWHSPQRAVGLPGSAAPRPSADTIDIGAYEYAVDGSGGSGATGGAAGASSGGGASGSGTGTGTGGVAAGGNGGGTGSGGSPSSGGAGGAPGSGGSSATGATTEDASGWGCRMVPARTSNAALTLALLALASVRRRRIRGSTHSVRRTVGSLH